jgi:hypothetical protein
MSQGQQLIELDGTGCHRRSGDAAVWGFLLVPLP